MKKVIVFCVLLVGSLLGANCQIKRTVIPMKDALSKALEKTNLTKPGSQPFHIKIVVSEPENLQSPYQGVIEEWWVSPDQWRREVTAKEIKQTIVVVNGKKTEHDEGDYFPLWLRNFVSAAFNPVPNAAAWSASGNQIVQITMPNGAKSDACARSQSKIGSGARATDAFSNVCFDSDGLLKFFGSPRYSVEFHNYHRFGKIQFPEEFVDDPEPGTKLVGSVTVLEKESKVENSSNLFTPLNRNDNLFESIAVSSNTMEQLSSNSPAIVWPSVRSGNVQGKLAMYISVDRDGRVREAWPLNSDNAGLNDPAREQVRRWKLKPAVDKNGNHVQVDGGLGFAFTTTIENPLPELSDSEVRKLAINTIEPRWPSEGLHSGEVVEVRVSVNEEGELTGEGYSKVPVAAQGAVMKALSQWRFRPLIRDGKPQYFHGTVRFIIP
ncbi:MAG TPA: energy transducer TonB [Edaphobacter sp.]|nr:energy transducer TonB [Edaphobacter sp.]